MKRMLLRLLPLLPAVGGAAVAMRGASEAVAVPSPSPAELSAAARPPLEELSHEDLRDRVLMLEELLSHRMLGIGAFVVGGGAGMR